MSTRFSKPPVSNIADRAARLASPESLAFVATGSMEPAQDSNPTEPPVVTQAPVPEKSTNQASPWDGLSDRHPKQVPFRMPENEAEMLKFIAETTYGASVQSILLEQARNFMEGEFAARGYKVTRGSNGKLIVVPKGRR